MPTYVIEREFRKDDRLIRLRQAHRSYWLRQADAGMLLVGGSWPDGVGELLVLRARGLSAVHAALGGDPLARERLVRETGIRVLESLIREVPAQPDEPREARGAPTAPQPPPAGTQAGTQAGTPTGRPPGTPAATQARRPTRTTIRAAAATPTAPSGPTGHTARPTATRPALAERLNAHELRVAQLILAGLTNREIAEAFRVTPRAVEQHITRIYRTLHISRRAQLANALRDLGPGQPSPLIEVAS